MTLPVLFLALFWGVIWACCLQFAPLGRYLAARRTWLTVVIGVGVDLLILALMLEPAQLLRVAAVIACSSIGIIARSVLNEWRDHQESLARSKGRS